MPTRRAAPGDVLELFVLSQDREPGLRAGPSSDAAQVLATFRNARVLAAFPRRGGEAGARWQRIIRVHEKTLAVLEGRTPMSALPAGRELRELGRDLFESLLPGDVRRLYDTARALQKGRSLDVVFTSMLDWVADKPWELAFDPSRREFVATSSVNLVRNAFTAVPADAPARGRGRLRILAVASLPRGAAPLDTKTETTDLRKAFSSLTTAGRAEVEVLAKATPGRLQRRLAKGGVDVLHFMGHGDFDEREREGSLLLEDDQGRPRRLGSDALRQVLCGRGLRLVFLNACETGRGGRVEWNRGVAPALVAAGLPAVVANQYPVMDTAATAFAGELYAQLAAGRALGDAAREARVAVSRDLGPGAIDWAVPVLFARDPREPLR
ncbi:MAG TPA: CHAT domain-containing protein [Vicinamibacteria bacterium]|nr:CHAT domain-containing protein [Vicinamibacteria bacterium]